MNRNKAKVIAEKITNEQLAQMLENAKNIITNWNKVSVVNKGMTKGVAWNFLARDFDVNHNYHPLSKRNMIREFGDYLPDDVKKMYIEPKPKRPKPIHQEPIFNQQKIS